MSDYGFKTYNERTGKEEASINSKYPIFGPNYYDIKTAFRTTHISDIKTYNVRGNTLSIPTPNKPYYGYNNYYGVNRASGYTDYIIAEYEHGYKFRPIGYFTVTGNLVGNLVGQLQQTTTVGGSTYGGNFTVYLNKNYMDITLTPAVGELATQTGSATQAWEYVNVTVGTTGSNYDFKVPSAVPGVFLTQNNYDATIPFRGYDATPPYFVEITDTKVIIKKRVYWAEQVLRAKTPSSNTFDIYERSKIIENFAGSELDFTVYLCPYKEEDLL